MRILRAQYTWRLVDETDDVENIAEVGYALGVQRRWEGDGAKEAKKKWFDTDG